MRFAIVLALALAACSPAREPAAAPAAAPTSTFDVAFLDTIGHAPVTHVAVGGKLRVKIPDDSVISAVAFGPFAVTSTSADTLAITATGAGAGEIEIETVTGYTRFSVTAAPIARVGMVFDRDHPRDATIALLDAGGKRLVDASLRIAPGSAPVSFGRDTWDHVVFETLPPGDVLVKTDLMAATRAIVEPATDGSLARR